MINPLFRLSAILVFGAPFLASAQGAIILQGGPFEDDNLCFADLTSRALNHPLRPLIQDQNQAWCTCFRTAGSQGYGETACPVNVPNDKYGYNTVWHQNFSETPPPTSQTTFPPINQGGPNGSTITTPGSANGSVIISPGSSNDSGNTNPSVSLINPLKAANPTDFLYGLIDLAISIGTIVVVLMLVYVGYLFATSSINPENKNTARAALLWTLVGALILLGSKAIALGIQATVAAISGP